MFENCWRGLWTRNMGMQTWRMYRDLAKRNKFFQFALSWTEKVWEIMGSISDESVV